LRNFTAILGASPIPPRSILAYVFGVQVILDEGVDMRVFVAGATGAIGRELVPGLVRAGSEILGMKRSELKQAMLDELGAVPVRNPKKLRPWSET
jgi:hypothetical protein